MTCLMTNFNWSYAGGDGSGFVFLGISNEGSLTITREKNSQPVEGLFSKCAASVMTVQSRPSRIRLLWAKTMGREANWSDLAEHRRALAYLRALPQGASLFVAHMGSSWRYLSECEAEVSVWQLMRDHKEKIIGVEAYRNY